MNKKRIIEWFIDQLGAVNAKFCVFYSGLRITEIRIDGAENLDGPEIDIDLITDEVSVNSNEVDFIDYPFLDYPKETPLFEITNSLIQKLEKVDDKHDN